MKKPKETFDKWYYTVCNGSDSRVELAKKAFNRGRKFEKEKDGIPMEVKRFISDVSIPHFTNRTKYIG